MDLNKPNGKTAKAAKAAKEAEEIKISTADILAMVAEQGQPLKEALLDLPAQVYTLSRVTLAARFIHEQTGEGGEIKTNRQVKRGTPRILTASTARKLWCNGGKRRCALKRPCLSSHAHKTS